MKNKPAIYLLFAANSISGCATGITMIAIPWYFANVIGKGSLFGYIYLAASFASLFWGLFAGSLIDKYNRRNIFIANAIVMCLLISSVAAYGWAGHEIPIYMVALVFVSTFFMYNIHYPNLYAFAQEITHPKDFGRINSYIEIQGQATNAFAGALAAILLAGTPNGNLSLFGFQLAFPVHISRWSLHEIFTLDASTYLLAILFISIIRYVPVHWREKDSSGIVARIKRGLDFLRHYPLIFLFGMASYSIFITVLVSTFYLMPVYINNHLHADASVYASFEMYFAMGAIIAGLSVNMIFERTGTVFGIICLCLTATAIYFICIGITFIPLFYILTLLFGLSNAGTRVMRMTYLFNHIPNEVIGRTNSVFNVFGVLFRMAFIFLFSQPFFHTSNNVIYSFMAFGIFTLCGAMLLIIYYKKLLTFRVPGSLASESSGEGN